METVILIKPSIPMAIEHGCVYQSVRYSGYADEKLPFKAFDKQDKNHANEGNFNRITHIGGKDSPPGECIDIFRKPIIEPIKDRACEYGWNKN